MRAADLGTRRVILAFFAAGSFVRFDGESTLPPQAATDNLQCQGLKIIFWLQLFLMIFDGCLRSRFFISRLGFLL